MKKIMIIILIISLLFSFGCIKKEKDTETTSGKSYAFTGGKSGITVAFEEGMPSSTVSAGEEAGIELKLTNTGAISLSPGEIKAKLKGVAATDIFDSTKTETSNDEELLAAELDPSVTTIDLGSITYTGEMIRAEYSPEIEAEICFPYLTEMQTNNLWISDDSTHLKKGKISSKDNSDAPVHVLDLEERVSGGKVKFEFVVENVGRGKIVDSCFPEEKDIEEVEVEISQPSGVTCETLGGSSYGTVKLTNGRKLVKCEVGGVQPGDNYNVPLIIKLNYNYDLELSKKITIEK